MRGSRSLVSVPTLIGKRETSHPREFVQRLIITQHIVHPDHLDLRPDHGQCFTLLAARVASIILRNLRKDPPSHALVIASISIASSGLAQR